MNNSTSDGRVTSSTSSRWEPPQPCRSIAARLCCGSGLIFERGQREVIVGSCNASMLSSMRLGIELSQRIWHHVGQDERARGDALVGGMFAARADFNRASVEVLARHHTAAGYAIADFTTSRGPASLAGRRLSENGEKTRDRLHLPNTEWKEGGPMPLRASKAGGAARQRIERRSAISRRGLSVAPIGNDDLAPAGDAQSVATRNHDFANHWTCVQHWEHYDAGMKLGELTDDALVSRMAAFCREEQALLAHVLAGIIEIEKRQLHLELASSSLYDFCVNRLGMSEGTAFRRIAAARLVKEFPCLLPHVANSGLHLSGLLLLRGHMTAANAEKLAADASGLPESKLKELLAARFPRPPVPERVEPLAAQGTLGHAAAPASPPRSSTEPLSSTAYLARLTLSAATHAKLLRARDMLMHRERSGDLATVVDRALDVLLDKLERDRLGKADHPHASRVGDTDISRSTRREVIARDGEQCTYRSKSGDRCQARALLEFDHGHARALGGAHGPDNVRILCAAHNHFRAEKDFGKGYVARMVAHQRATTASRKRHTTTITTPVARHEPGATDAGSHKQGAGYVVPWDIERRELANGMAHREGLCGTAVPWGIERAEPSVEALGSARGEGSVDTACTSIDEGRRVLSTDAGNEDSGAAARTFIDDDHRVLLLPTGARDKDVGAAAIASIDEGRGRSPAPIPADAEERCGSTDCGGGRVRDGDRAVYGLVSLGFERDASVDTVRTLLGHGGAAPSLVELMRKAIGILANAGPSPGSKRRARRAAAR